MVPSYQSFQFWVDSQSLISCLTLLGMGESELIPSNPRNLILFHFPKSFQSCLCDLSIYCSKKLKNCFELIPFLNKASIFSLVMEPTISYQNLYSQCSIWISDFKMDLTISQLSELVDWTCVYTLKLVSITILHLRLPLCVSCLFLLWKVNWWRQWLMTNCDQLILFSSFKDYSYFTTCVFFSVILYALVGYNKLKMSISFKLALFLLCLRQPLISMDIFSQTGALIYSKFSLVRVSSEQRQLILVNLHQLRIGLPQQSNRNRSNSYISFLQLGGSQEPAMRTGLMMYFQRLVLKPRKSLQHCYCLEYQIKDKSYSLQNTSSNSLHALGSLGFNILLS